MGVLIAAAGALVVMAYVIWQRHGRCVDLIEAELRRHHFTGIKASVSLGRISLSAYTFDVRYNDRRGRRHRNRATISVSDDWADSVRWQHRLERLSSPRKIPQETDGDAGITLEGRLPLISDARGRHALQ
jgi:hypothetical protein